MMLFQPPASFYLHFWANTSSVLCLKSIFILMSTLGDRLKQLRGSLSQSDFAASIGVSQRTIGHYEKNERQPDAEAIKNICANFQVSPSWLLFGQEEKSPASAISKRQYSSQHTENTENSKKLPPTVGDSPTEEVTLLASQVREMATMLMEAGREIQRLSRENVELQISLERLRTAAEPSNK